MTARSESPSGTANREITATRVFDAPRDLVWRAMTDPAQVIHWWGPRGFTTTIEEMDLRPGGKWTHVMRGPDGAEYPNRSVFTEIVPGKKVVFAHAGEKKGGPSVQFESTWLFDAVGENKTRVTVRMVFSSAEERDRVGKDFGAIEGLNQTLSRLRERLVRESAGPGEVFVIEREFAAPRDLVFRAWTEPKMLEHWWGPKGCGARVLSFDLRLDGTAHFSMRTPDGKVMMGKWVFREIAPPERIVFVNSFADEKMQIVRHPYLANWPLEILTTVTFAEEHEKTKVIVHWVPICPTEAERVVFTKHHESMQKGWGGSLDELTDFLAKR